MVVTTILGIGRQFEQFHNVDNTTISNIIYRHMYTGLDTHTDIHTEYLEVVGCIPKRTQIPEVQISVETS